MVSSVEGSGLSSLVSYNKGRDHTKEEKACEDDLGAGEPSAEGRWCWGLELWPQPSRGL